MLTLSIPPPAIHNSKSAAAAPPGKERLRKRSRTHEMNRKIKKRILLALEIIFTAICISAALVSCRNAAVPANRRTEAAVTTVGAGAETPDNEPSERNNSENHAVPAGAYGGAGRIRSADADENAIRAASPSSGNA